MGFVFDGSQGLSQLGSALEAVSRLFGQRP
jgi:hypothetical protein